MKKYFWFALTLIFPTIVLGLDFVPNQLIFKTDLPKNIENNCLQLNDFDDFLAQHHVQNIKSIRSKKYDEYFVVTFENDISWDEIKNLNFDGISYFQPNYLNEFHVVPNDPKYFEQIIDFQNCNIPQSWNYTVGNHEIIVGVVDSGIHFDHPDLQNNIFINDNEIPNDGIDNDNNGYIDDWRGWDFVDAPELYSIALGDFTEQDNDASDELNHGTHVAGIIAADTNNNEGISGICWNISILPIRAGFKTIDGMGYLQDDDAAAGIIYAADMGAEVVNISWGDVNFSQIIADACDYATQKGVIIIASAGNEGCEVITYPGKLASTISVGAVDTEKELTSFSSFGSQLDLVAPGKDIISSYGNETENLYFSLSGTSMSAPFVSAATALLLSVEPSLNSQEVRGKLISSTIDLGATGFDNLYGNGFLDIYSLLTNDNFPIIEISAPLDNAGISEDFEIFGTVTAPNFWRYSVQYTSSALPEIEDWLDVDANNPFYYDEVENGCLATFNIDTIQDTTYQIKVEYSTPANQLFTDITTVHINRNAATFIDSLATTMKRYCGENPHYFLQSVFDEKVFLQIKAPPSTEYFLATNSADSIQICEIPNCYDGSDNVAIKAVNLAGLETIIENENNYFFEPNYQSINTHSFTQDTFSANELTAIRKTHDFNENGKSEIIALLGNTEDSRILAAVEISENNNSAMTNFFSEEIWPHDLGDSNNDGKLEIFGIQNNYPIIYDYTTPNITYPNIIVIVDTITAYGGNFCDYNNDGIDDLIVVGDVNSTRHSLILYQRLENGSFFLDGVIPNTLTDGKFVNRVYCDFLDDNPFVDILIADNKGNIVVYEIIEDEISASWQTKLPVPEAYYSAIGDFDGDGGNEFCVGGYMYEPSQPEKSFSYFAFFKYEDNDYNLVDYVSFGEVESKNSIATADFNGDDDDEIIIAVPPNIYVIDYNNGNYLPIWQGETVKTSQNVIAAKSTTEQEDGFIVANIQNGEELASSIMKIDLEGINFSGPATPSFFEAIPIDSTKIKLSWIADNFDYFKIYKKENDNTALIDSTTNLSFVDSLLTVGDTVSYQITKIDLSLSPCESLPTTWQTTAPVYTPKIVAARMISQYALRVTFDAQLGADATNISCHFVTPTIGNPISVNIIENNFTLILRFNHFFSAENYTLYCDGLSGATGIIIQDSISFKYIADTFAPEIISSETLDKQTLHLVFSEKMKADLAENIANYTMIPPIIDSENEIQSIETSLDSIEVFITLKNNMQHVNQQYFLKISNIEDANSNKISNFGNKCHFGLTNFNLNNLIVYPNPIDFSKSKWRKMNFINLPLGMSGKIFIYDLAGNLIFSDEIKELSKENQFYSWNCKNNFGLQISSGIYFYILKMGEQSQKGKFIIIN